MGDLIERDAKNVADISRIADMRRLFGLLAQQQGGLLNASRLAGELSIIAPTVRHYLEILETIYVIRRIPAWSSGATRRALGMSKLIFVDSGISSHLATGALSNAPVGGIIENFVLGELARLLTWAQTSARLYHYRDRDGYEVDGVIEDNAGQLVGIEVKAAETVRSGELAGIAGAPGSTRSPVPGGVRPLLR